MAHRNHIMTQAVGYYIGFLTVLAYMLNGEFVESRKITAAKNQDLVKQRGTIKTIKSEDGDVIDCVDIYKQPAFDHLLLKNHIIEMRPNSYPIRIKPINHQAKIIQHWLKNGECPERSVPVRRALKQAYGRPIPLTQHNEKLPQSITKGGHYPYQYAEVSQSGNNYYGAHARINIWNPTTEISGEFSSAQIRLLSGREASLNSIEAGWMVYPEYYNDNQTRFYVYWTKDDYQSTGCYNLDCPGFVQISEKFVVGATIKPTSGYGAEQYDLPITIYKDNISAKWWLLVQNETIGYWPSSIFTSLANSASEIIWGGEVITRNSMGHHTSTQMGSGHFSSEGYGKSSYFRNLQVMDQFGTLKDPEKLLNYVAYPTCYDLHVQANNSDYGTYFFFGGPGYSDKCP